MRGRHDADLKTSRAEQPRQAPREASTHSRFDTAELARHFDAVRRFCRARTSSEVDAEDAAQQAFLRYLERAGDNVRNPEAWLIQAASFECRDLHRRQRRRIGIEPEDGSLPATPGDADPESTVVHRMLAQSLLGRLSANDRRLLTMRYLDDMSVEQLAARLRVTQGNARIMALRARRRAHAVLVALEGGAAAIGTFALVRVWRRLRSATRDTVARVSARLSSLAHPDWSALSVMPAGAQVLVPTVIAVVLAAPGLSPASHGTVAVANAGPRLGGGFFADTPNAEKVRSSTPFGRGGNIPSGTFGGLTGGSSGAAPLVTHVVAPQQTATQQDATFTSVQASSDYSHDHTLFASGTMVRNCSSGACPVLFRSTDGGVTWQPRPGASFAGGRLLMPVNGASTLFVVGPLGLQRSDDAGGSFRLAIPGVTAAALLPGDGVPDVLIGSVPLAVYHTSTGLLSPGPALPAGVTTINDAVYAGDSDHLTVSAWQADATAPSQQRAVLLSCTTSVCANQVQLDGPYAIHLDTLPTTSGGHTVVGYWDAGAVVSEDGGVTYRTLAWSGHGALVSVALDPGYAVTRRILVGVLGTASGSMLYTSDDGGNSLAATPTKGLPARLALSQIVALADGSVIAALTSPDDAGAFGLRCSGDGGRTWYLSCGAH